MTLKECIEQLNKVHSRYEQLHEVEISNFKKELNKAQDELGAIIQELEDDGVDSEQE